MFSTDAFASSNEGIYKDGEIIIKSDSLYEPDQSNTVITEAGNSVTPYAIFYKRDKTISVYYSSFSNIPTEYHYKEYYQGYWYEGILKLKSVVASGTGYTCVLQAKSLENCNE